MADFTTTGSDLFAASAPSFLVAEEEPSPLLSAPAHDLVFPGKDIVRSGGEPVDGDSDGEEEEEESGDVSSSFLFLLWKE